MDAADEWLADAADRDAFAAVESEVLQRSGGALAPLAYVIEGRDLTGRIVQVFAVRLTETTPLGTTRIYRGASFRSPADAMRQALRHHQEGVATEERRHDAAG
jgi:hypothetical protein